MIRLVAFAYSAPVQFLKWHQSFKRTDDTLSPMSAEFLLTTSFQSSLLLKLSFFRGVDERRFPCVISGLILKRWTRPFPTSSSIGVLLSRLFFSVSDRTALASDLPRRADKACALSVRICLADLALGSVGPNDRVLNLSLRSLELLESASLMASAGCSPPFNLTGSFRELVLCWKVSLNSSSTAFILDCCSFLFPATFVFDFCYFPTITTMLSYPGMR